MALSKQDQAFYEQKLGYKAIGYLYGVTVVVGAVAWPSLLYVEDSMSGNTTTWDFNVVFRLAVIGFLLGSVVATLMYLLFKFLLEMGWLPSRH